MLDMFDAPPPKPKPKRAAEPANMLDMFDAPPTKHKPKVDETASSISAEVPKGPVLMPGKFAMYGKLLCYLFIPQML